MAFVITTRPNQDSNDANRIIGMGENLDFWDNGYPRLLDQNIAYPDWMVYVNGVETDGKTIPESIEIPKGVEENKYCYTKEQGFYENPNWKEPTPDEENPEVARLIRENESLKEEVAKLQEQLNEA